MDIKLGETFLKPESFFQKSIKQTCFLSIHIILILPLLWPLNCNTESTSDFNLICSYHFD